VTDVFASLVSLLALLISALTPQAVLPSRKPETQQLEEVDGPLCPAPGCPVLFFFPRIVDESIGHPAGFCPLFAATLSMYHGCRRASDRAEVVPRVAPRDDSWRDEREGRTRFRFYISRMNTRAAILTVITNARRQPRRYIKSNIKLIRAVGYHRRCLLFIRDKK